MEHGTSKKLETGRALYGLAGWVYEDWDGIVYPRPRPRGFRPIPFLSTYFGVLEINSSFYRIPAPGTTESWAAQARAAGDLVFTMKLWQGFTHETREWTESDAVAFEAAAAPLRDAKRLGSVLIQFPWSFRANEASVDHLRRLLDRFGAFPLTVEVRHTSWLADDLILGILRERGAAFCNIDQPSLRHNIPLTDHVTADHAYLRVHGRNRANWFRETATGAERYDYLYSQTEVEDLARIVQRLKRKAKCAFVIANNHWRGQAAANTLQLRAAAENEKIEAPVSLVKHFGNLGPNVVAEKDSVGEQLEMF